MEALKAARCFDGERFRPQGVTVMVEGERIVGVEPLAYDVPDGVEVTAYAGTLLPGLVDGHVHLVSDSSLGSLERAGSASDEELAILKELESAPDSSGASAPVPDRTSAPSVAQKNSARESAKPEREPG